MCLFMYFFMIIVNNISMLKEKIYNKAKEIEKDIISYRRCLHSIPEIGFNTVKTVDFIRNELEKIGCIVEDCGKKGIVTIIGNRDKSLKTFLIRADMDGLPILEDTDLKFKSKNGNMHACGHDMHTAMLLGAARILKEYEPKIKGTVKLMFQPAEETLEGARDMLEDNVLENPKVDAALMIHVMTNVSLKPGSIIVAQPGNSAPSADFFQLEITGKGCHGSSPHLGIDPINIGCNIVFALQELIAKEISMLEQAALTIGEIKGADGANVIPNKVVLKGSLRSFSNNTREYIKKRIEEIATGIAGAFRGQCKTTFTSGCPPLKNDANVVESVYKCIKELLGDDMVYSAKQFLIDNQDSAPSGSEDFSYISQKIPTVMLALAAGEPKEGYVYPLHHPKVIFDEKALCYGSAVYAYSAIKWLENNN